MLIFNIRFFLHRYFILIALGTFSISVGLACNEQSNKIEPEKSVVSDSQNVSPKKEKESFFAPAKKILKKEGQKIDRSKIRIEVLNGCGKKGIAKKVTNRLRNLGYDVVNVGNAESFHYDVTIIIDRTGNLENAKDVAKALETDNYIQQIDKKRFLEISVIIGRDYQKIFPNIKGEQAL